MLLTHLTFPLANFSAILHHHAGMFSIAGLALNLKCLIKLHESSTGKQELLSVQLKQLQLFWLHILKS